MSVDTPLSLTSTLGFFYEEKLPTLRSFLQLFFPNFFVTEQTQIQVDRFFRGRKRAFYKPLGGSSNLLAFTNGEAIMYKPPVIDLSTPVSEDLAQAITVGTPANASQNEHLTKKYAMIQDQQSEDIMTEIVLQGMDVLRTGAFTAKTSADQSVGAFSYDRDATLDINYDVGVKGGINWLKEMYVALKAQRMPNQNIIVLVGSTMMSALEESDAFKEYVDTNHYIVTNGAQAGDIAEGNAVISKLVKVKIPGTTHYATLLSFDATYDVSGTETPFVPDAEAIMTTLNTPRTSAFAGIFITDLMNNSGRTYSGEMISDRVLTQNPDELSIRTQSRPLLIPGNINHTCRLTGSNF